jgi:hypothetical protein
MNAWVRIAILITLLTIICYLIVGQLPFLQKSVSSLPQKIAVLFVTITPTPLVSIQSAQSKCQIKGVLPDSLCTPGAIDPKVTQDSIYQTICVKGYTATVRPPVSYTNKLKLQQITDYGYADRNPKNYEEDHLISLELGGSPSDPKNLWPEPGSSPNPKDEIENLCNKKVCSGQITLTQAQQEIASNWQTACQ